MSELTPEDFVKAWRDAGAARWFYKDPAFDDALRERFLGLHERAARGELDGATSRAEGALGVVLLLDQFPRNAFRGTARVYATDALAKAHADRAIAAGFDARVPPELRFFFYLPFAHSERLEDQDRSVELHERAGVDASHAVGHRDIIRRFGRFPHRAAILGRDVTREEREFLDSGGFAG